MKIKKIVPRRRRPNFIMLIRQWLLLKYLQEKFYCAGYWFHTYFSSTAPQVLRLQVIKRGARGQGRSGRVLQESAPAGCLSQRTVSVRSFYLIFGGHTSFLWSQLYPCFGLLGGSWASELEFEFIIWVLPRATSGSDCHNKKFLFHLTMADPVKVMLVINFGAQCGASKWEDNKQECIPVGCVPAAHWPSGGGVCIQEGFLGKRNWKKTEKKIWRTPPNFRHPPPRKFQTPPKISDTPPTRKFQTPENFRHPPPPKISDTPQENLETPPETRPGTPPPRITLAQLRCGR